MSQNLLKVFGIARTRGGMPINNLRLMLQMTGPDGQLVGIGGTDVITSGDGSFGMSCQIFPGMSRELTIFASIDGQLSVVTPPSIKIPPDNFDTSAVELDLRVAPADGTLAFIPEVPRRVPCMGEVSSRLASDLGAMQAELNRYPLSGGAFVIDQMELALPLVTLVDDLGQVRARIAGPEEQSNSIRFLIRPVFDVPPQTLLAPGIPIGALEVLTEDQATMLHLRRIDDVAALAQVLRSPTATQALVASGFPVEEILARLQLVLESGVPTDIALALLKVGITSTLAFVSKPPSDMAILLARVLPIAVAEDKISQWQREVRVRAGWEPTSADRPTL